MSPRPARTAAEPAPEPRLRRTTVPIREPRDAARVRPAVTDEPPPTQGTLALALPWEGTDPEDGASTRRRPGRRPGARPGPRPDTRSTPEPRGPADGEPVPAGPRPGGALPEPREWAATFALAAMEVAAGLRPSGQLIRWTTPDVHEALTLRGVLNARRRQAPSFPPGRPAPARPAPARLTPAGRKVRLRALVAGIPVDGVCEVAAVLRAPDRVRAVAFRMEGHYGRWRVTALQIG